MYVLLRLEFLRMPEKVIVNIMGHLRRQCTSNEVEPLAEGMELPTAEVAAALNSAFFEGEASSAYDRLDMRGRRLAPSKRLELGDFLVVRLEEAASIGSAASQPGSAASRAELGDRGDDASSFLQGTGSGFELSAAAVAEAEKALSAEASVAAGPGAWICSTRRWVLVVAFDAGMDDKFALKVCVGLAEHLASEGQ
ncbi:unnamed protein product [Polarella glacialis]|uniref:Uncharacterized protein n=1 Tax=Polarella glacialis TaxID=89957 RepID=A0A813L885_POLGL|nr:unnamed protein product [Polarella glacialis]